MNPFPFIVGCGRSGTTLLRAMLDSHPDLAVTPESYFVIPSLRGKARYGPPDRFRVSGLLDDILSAGSFLEWRLDAEEVRAAIYEAAPRSVPNTLCLLYQYYALAQGKSLAADKTPYHVLHIGKLSEAFPAARFVHVIRDGRDVVPSLLAAPFGPNHFRRAVLYWRRHVEAGRRAGQRLGRDRYIEVRYEQLVASTEATLRNLCTFLHMTYDPRLLAYHERASDVLAGLRRTEHLQGVRQKPTVGVRDWRNTMTEADLRSFEALAGVTRERIGYEPSPVTPSTGDRLRGGGALSQDLIVRRSMKLRRQLRVARMTIGAGRNGKG